MKLEPSRFSSHCMLIAVLALVAGIAVTVEAAAQQVGIRTIVTERAQNTIVMLLPREETSARPPLSDAPALPEYFPGEI
ncbi:MAG TPA: hypothetical protein VLQ65_06905 [Saliniramus sp.]|nr:hypothetical protein [Saliniramus sp.]